ncbi:MAG TPA: response regulator [Puia sp.]|nr:response regulator [Puia sp.]
MKTNETVESNVLIVDDEPDICFLLGGMLRQRHLKTFFANNLTQAEASLHDHLPSLMFLDNRLPDGFGLDFIPFIKKNYPGTKVIMMTAHDSISDRRRAFEEGVDFFLSKPLSKELINVALNTVA